MSLIPAMIAGWVYIQDSVAIDKCLDLGGSYDYLNSKCDFENNHTVVPFNHRYPKIYTGVILGFGALIVIALTPARNKKAEPEN